MHAELLGTTVLWRKGEQARPPQSRVHRSMLTVKLLNRREQPETTSRQRDATRQRYKSRMAPLVLVVTSRRQLSCNCTPMHLYTVIYRWACLWAEACCAGESSIQRLSKKKSCFILIAQAEVSKYSISPCSPSPRRSWTDLTMFFGFSQIKHVLWNIHSRR